MTKKGKPRHVLDVYLDVDELRTNERTTRFARLGWMPRYTHITNRAMWDDNVRSLRVLETIERHDSRGVFCSRSQRWHHVSLSHQKKRAPTWAEMSEIKRVFMGEDVEAYIVHPPRSRYYTLEGIDVLHWYACLDAPDGVLPDFRVVGVEPNRQEGIGL